MISKQVKFNLSKKYTSKKSKKKSKKKVKPIKSIKKSNKKIKEIKLLSPKKLDKLIKYANKQPVKLVPVLPKIEKIDTKNTYFFDHETLIQTITRITQHLPITIENIVENMCLYYNVPVSVFLKTFPKITKYSTTQLLLVCQEVNGLKTFMEEYFYTYLYYFYKINDYYSCAWLYKKIKDRNYNIQNEETNYKYFIVIHNIDDYPENILYRLLEHEDIPLETIYKAIDVANEEQIKMSMYSPRSYIVYNYINNVPGVIIPIVPEYTRHNLSIVNEMYPHIEDCENFENACKILKPQISYVYNMEEKFKMALIDFQYKNQQTEKDNLLTKIFNNIPPLKNNLTVYRGSKTSDLNSKNKYVSTSVCRTSAIKFAKGDCCMFIIKIIEKSKAIPVFTDSYKHEAEVLLNSSMGTFVQTGHIDPIKLTDTFVKDQHYQLYGDLNLYYYDFISNYADYMK